MARRDPSTDDPDAPARPGRRRRWALGAGASLVVVLALLWAERRPIAVHFIDRTLAADGVRARYRLETIGPGRQRLTGVVVGDPARPDLVADWIETETGFGPSGIALTGLRAGRVRARARLVDGRLSFGAIDRLLPSGGGGGGLPRLALAIADARLRVDTPAGVVGVALAGHGRVEGGFEGRAAVAGGSLALGSCTLAPPRAMLRVWTRAGRVGLAGPASAEQLDCGATRWRAPRATVDLNLDPATGKGRGRWQVDGGPLADPRAQARSIGGGGTVEFGGGQVSGHGGLAADGATGHGFVAGQVFAIGNYALGADSRFDGRVGASGVTVINAVRWRSGAAALAGTPVGPLADGVTTAIANLARSMTGTVTVRVRQRGTTTSVAIGRAIVTAPTGAFALFEGEADPAGAIAGQISIAGGGLPKLAATVRRQGAGTPITGVLTLSPYAVGSASLALARGSFAIRPDGAARIATVATLSGPVGDGRVDGVSMSLTVRRDAAGGLFVNEACAPATIGALVNGGLRLDATRLVLCPVGGALLRVAADAAIGGGARVGAVQLAGRLGDEPLAIAASGATMALATLAFTANGVAATLGGGDRPTRFEATALTGAIGGGGVAGRFEGAGGRIGAVPLLLSRAAGTWRVADGRLELAGGMTVADADAPNVACLHAAATPPRFCPLAAHDVALRLGDGRIAATGTLVEPATGTRVAGVTIAHELASGAGHADLSIDHLAFAKGGLQPDRLTPVTQGVIADVAGTIDGEGHIGWGGGGVTSSGRFATAGLDLAAAFGPVTGIAGAVTFTDLLGLVSAPGQRLTVASINPGVLVENGAIAFHTEPGVKVAVESARWPFAGGRLTLDPTLLDFSAPAERHLTFRLDGIAADRFIEQFDFKNLAATGTFDGVLPMVFDAHGGRIEAGRLTVREGGGGLAYVGDLSQKELGFWSNLAFQALKSLRYRNLSILMNGPLDGEIVTGVRFAGVSQGQGARSNFLVRRLQRLPFVFNVTIRAPFRTLLDGLDPARQAQLHFRELIDNARRPVQPPASGAVP